MVLILMAIIRLSVALKTVMVGKANQLLHASIGRGAQHRENMAALESRHQETMKALEGQNTALMELIRRTSGTPPTPQDG